MQFFRFGISQGSAKTLVRRGGITNHRSIAYSLSNISAKNYPKSVDVWWSSGVWHQCRFFRDTVYIMADATRLTTANDPYHASGVRVQHDYRLLLLARNPRSRWSYPVGQMPCRQQRPLRTFKLVPEGHTHADSHGEIPSQSGTGYIGILRSNRHQHP